MRDFICNYSQSKETSTGLQNIAYLLKCDMDIQIFLLACTFPYKVPYTKKHIDLDHIVLTIDKIIATKDP